MRLGARTFHAKRTGDAYRVTLRAGAGAGAESAGAVAYRGESRFGATHHYRVERYDEAERRWEPLPGALAFDDPLARQCRAVAEELAAERLALN